MKTIHKLKCNNKRGKCKNTSDLIKVSSRISKKTGDLTQYYRCNKCNRERMRAYMNTKKGKERVYSSLYKSMKKHKEKQNARLVLLYHIKHGNILRPSSCIKCERECKPHGHHKDYKKPLDVIWVCRRCHMDIHKLLRSKK